MVNLLTTLGYGTRFMYVCMLNRAPTVQQPGTGFMWCSGGAGHGCLRNDDVVTNAPTKNCGWAGDRMVCIGSYFKWYYRVVLN